MTSSPEPESLRPVPARFRRGHAVAAVTCAVAGLALFQFFGNANQGYIATDSLFWWWVYQWMNPASETEHGWLILGIAVWLFVRNLRGDTNGGDGAPPSRVGEVGAGAERGGHGAPPSNVGAGAERGAWSDLLAPAAALLSGLALHAIGFAAQQARISIIALLLFTWGVLRLGGGRRWGAAAMFPVAFLVFAIPVNVLDTLGFWLRLWVVDASTTLAQAAGIGVVQSGTQLFAPDGRYSYDVAAACSGVRSLMALAALSLLIGYLNFRVWWRRGMILLLCFPLVYIGNVARIAAIVFAAEYGGSRWGDAAHAIMGWGVFVIVLGGVLGAAALMRRAGGDDTNAAASGRAVGGAICRDEFAADQDRGVKPLLQRGLKAPLMVAGMVVIMAGSEMAFLRHLASLPARGRAGVVLAPDGRNPVELPTFLGRDWVGFPAPVSAVEREILPPDTGYSRMNYISSRGSRRVFLSIVLSGRDRTSIHRPELCLLGQGWTILSVGTHGFAGSGRAGDRFPATILKVQRQPATAGEVVVPQLVAYWFVGGDQVVPSHWRRLALDAWNRVAHGRADRWAYVLMQADAADGDAAALARMQEVLDGTVGVFQPGAARRTPTR